MSLYTRESMHYAFARSMLDIDQSIKLLQILKLKVNTYTQSFTLSIFLKCVIILVVLFITKV